MNPLVSICVPTYNGEKYLRECLNSVLAQTFSDFEVLIVDDQSSDNTFCLAQEYAEKDTRIRVMRNDKNLGLVGNWNRCVELASGEWIKFVFQDDLISPMCLEKMLAAATPNSSIICCLSSLIIEEGTPEHIQEWFKNFLSLEKLFPNLSEVSAEDFCKAVLDDPVFYNFVGEPTLIMLRRNVFQKFGTFNPHLVHICDFEFWTRIAVHTGLIFVPEKLATFRTHGNAASTKNYSEREYRTNILDPLILIHDFALHPIYAPLRDVAAKKPKSFDLGVKLRKHSFWAWVGSTQNFYSLEEWKKITYLYPAILKYSERNFIALITSYFKMKVGVFKPQLVNLLKSMFKNNSQGQVSRTVKNSFININS